MKKLVITALLLTSLSGLAQEKWRTLTFGSTSGSTIEGHMFTQGTASLDYELKNHYSINSWNGINYNFYNKSGWFSSQTTLDKRWSSFTLGAGYQYGSGYSTMTEPSKALYAIVKLQYRIKL